MKQQKEQQRKELFVKDLVAELVNNKSRGGIHGKTIINVSMVARAIFVR